MKRAALLAAGAVALLAGCSTTSISHTAPPASTAACPSGTSLDSNGTCLGMTPPSPSDTTTSDTTSGPVGTTFTVTTQNNNGQNVSYDITLTHVDQHAGLGAYETLNNPADHMAAARFTITGKTGQVSDDADSDAVAIGTDTTEYQPTFITVTDGGNFNSGEFSVAPGETVSGWVAFEIPAGQTVASVQWAPGFSGDHATWTVSG